MTRPAFNWLGLIVAAGMLACAGRASAETLRDPTQPPASLFASAAAPAPEASPVLQSVLLSPERKVAVINGEAVPLNGQFRQWKLVRISEAEVTLREGATTQVLKLFPDINLRRGGQPAR